MKKNLNILIIEDDKYTRLNLKEILSDFGVISEAKEIEEAFKILETTKYDIVITDIELHNRSGIEIIPTIVTSGAHCIVVSSYEGDEIIEKAYHLGAKHYLAKFNLKEQLPIYIQKYIQRKNAYIETLIKDSFITQDSRLIENLTNLCSMNLKNKSLFISGKTGTGKSLLGKIIHQVTHPDENFIHLNCSEIAENLLESELFGHEKGSFTGADQKKDGKLKLANGGTLFLDEIGTMSLGMQQKLLKAIDEKTFYPVGASRPVKSEFTLITATCEDIQGKIREREFREDLFYRISGYTFSIPDLKSRIDDLELLIKHFQLKLYRRFFIKQDAIEVLKMHSWPGNIRELEKVCALLAENETGIIDTPIINKIFQPSHQLNYKQDGWLDEVFSNGLNSYFKRIEKLAVEEALRRNNKKITNSIKELKISSSAFYRIMNENNLVP
jgi:DNA-binding NtrC family response regulator